MLLPRLSSFMPLWGFVGQHVVGANVRTGGSSVRSWVGLCLNGGSGEGPSDKRGPTDKEKQGFHYCIHQPRLTVISAPLLWGIIHSLVLLHKCPMTVVIHSKNILFSIYDIVGTSVISPVGRIFVVGPSPLDSSAQLYSIIGGGYCYPMASASIQAFAHTAKASTLNQPLESTPVFLKPLPHGSEA